MAAAERQMSQRRFENSSGRAQRQANALYQFFIMPIICYVFTAFHDYFQYKTVVRNCWEKTTTIKESTWQWTKHFNRLASQLYFRMRHSVVKTQGYTESKHRPPQKHTDTRHMSTAQQCLLTRLTDSKCLLTRLTDSKWVERVINIKT